MAATIAAGAVEENATPRNPVYLCLQKLRKLHGRLRSQLELPRQPSEGCSIGALGPAGEDELMRVVFGGHTLHNERLLERVGTTLVPTGPGLISAPFRRRFRDSFWS